MIRTAAVIAAFFALSAQAHAGEISQSVAAAVADDTRLDSHTERDEGRKPGKILSFSGIKKGDRLADLAAGSGYYTALLSRLVGDDGKIYAVDPVRILEAFPNAKNAFPTYIESDPRANVVYSAQKFDELTFDEPLDAVVMGLYYHDTVWTGADRAAMNKAILDALKPGGVYLVIDHLAADGAEEGVTKELHRMIPGVVRAEVEAAGFDFAGESKALSNDADDRETSVFDASIRGKTDRFVYLFRKPA